MCCPSWLLAAAVLCMCGTIVSGGCWETADCSSRDKVLECILKCRLEQAHDDSPQSENSPSSQEEEEEEEESLALGLVLSHLSPAVSPGSDGLGLGSPRNDERRSYSMEHFRWGKPMGRKRRPIKVYTALEDEGEEDSVETAVPVANKRQLGSPEEPRWGVPLELQQEKKEKPPLRYRMTHFRWNAPLAVKRYGGFTKPLDDPSEEQSQKPLLTLLRNIMMEDGH